MEAKGVIVPHPIAATIRAVTDHVREYAKSVGPLHDAGHELTDDEVAEYRQQISRICEELDKLAERSLSERVRFSEFEDLRVNLSVPLALLDAVADAFREEDGLN